MHWPSHCKAFYAQWIIRFLHPRRSPWKNVLREWVQNAHLRDGILLANVSDNHHKGPPESAPYIRQCLKAFGELKLRQDTTILDRACLGEPLFWNHRFTANSLSTTTTEEWQDQLEPRYDPHTRPCRRKRGPIHQRHVDRPPVQNGPRRQKK
jgi:hypothetical protein